MASLVSNFPKLIRRISLFWKFFLNFSFVSFFFPEQILAGGAADFLLPSKSTGNVLRLAQKLTETEIPLQLASLCPDQRLRLWVQPLCVCPNRQQDLFFSYPISTMRYSFSFSPYFPHFQIKRKPVQADSSSFCDAHNRTRSSLLL